MKVHTRFFHKTIIGFCLILILIPAFALAVEPDEYDASDKGNDDTSEQANIIILNNDTSRKHNFHDEGDEDWVKFFGLEGQTYRIEATNVGENCDVVIKLYDTDGITILETGNDGLEGQEDQLESLALDKDGIYHIRLFNDSDIPGEATGYELRLFFRKAPVASLFHYDGGVQDAFSENPLGDVMIRTSQTSYSALSDEKNDGDYTIRHPKSEDLQTPFLLFAKIPGYELYQKEIFTTEEGFEEMGPFPEDPETPKGGNRDITRQEVREWDGVIEMIPLGDVSGNGKIDLTDAIIALKASAGMDTQTQEEPPDPENPPAPIRPDYEASGADVNGDNKVGTKEAIHILRYLSGVGWVERSVTRRF